MPRKSTSQVVREILTADPNLSADDVIARAKSAGVTDAESAIRVRVHNVRSELKKGKAIPAANRQTTAPKSAPAKTPSEKGELAAVLANVTRVNAVVGQCGGVDQARRVAEAVRSCGGVEQFLEHLAVVAGVRATDSQ